MTPFTTLTFGPAKASKRALLLCGSWQVGLCWWRIAEEMVNAGYRVDAPDLPIELASRSVASHVDHLLSNLDVPAAGYEAVCGINLGALMGVKLIDRLPRPPRRVVMLDPPLGGQPPVELVEKVVGMFEGLQKETNEESLRNVLHGKGTPLDVSAKRVATLQNSAARLRGIIADNRDVSHDYLPSQAGSTEVVIAGPDPSAGMVIYNVEKWAPFLKEKYPHIRLLYYPGVGHDSMVELPLGVAETILGTEESWQKSSLLKVLQ